MYLDQRPTSDRIRAAIPVIAVHALLALVLLRGLQGGPVDKADDPLYLIPVPPPVTIVEPDRPPPPPADKAAPDPLRLADPRPEGAASPPNLKAEPTPFVAPEPIVRPPIQPPPTVTPSPIAGTGSAPSAGAAPIRGHGSGSGGLGNGRGSGSGGGGLGGGGGGGGGDGTGRVFTMPHQTGGDFSWRDIPPQLQESGFRGTVGVRFLIDVDGRAKQCRIIRRSGSALMDQQVCRLVEQRYRFVPARDVNGRPVAIPGEDYPSFRVDGGLDRERRRRDDD